MVRASARASPPLGSPANATRAAEEKSLSKSRIWLPTCWRAHTASCWARASHPDRPGQLGVGGSGRCASGAVRMMWPATPRRWHRIWAPTPHTAPTPRSRQRDDRIDHRPVARDPAPHSPRSVSNPYRDRILRGVAGLSQQRQQLREPARIVIHPPARHNPPVVIDHGDVVMFSGPIDSATQAQGLTTPLIGASVVPGGLARRPNRRIRWAVISLAVRESSTPQDLV